MTTNPPSMLDVANAQCVEIEKALLASVMLDPETLPLVSAKLEPGDFYYPVHQRIYRAMLELNAVNIQPGFFEVYQYIETFEFRVFQDLYDCCLPGASTSQYFVDQVREYARRRKAQAAMQKSLESLATPGADLADQWELLNSDFMKLLQEDGRIIGVEEQVLSTMKAIDSHSDADFIKTGLSKIDETTGGAQRGESWVIAGRTSQGKSSLAATFCLNMARAGETVLFVIVEGTRNAFMQRLFSIYSGVPLTNIRRGKLTPHDIPKIAHAAKIIGQLKISIVDDTEWAKIRAAIQMVKLKEPKLAAVFIDYLQLVRLPRERSREEEVSRLSNDIKRLAKELNVAMFPLAQLNRESDKRKDHRPMLSDLRESGAIENDADVVLFPYRPSYYDEKTDFPDDAEIAIGKNRDGATATAYVSFKGECVRFQDREE